MKVVALSNGIHIFETEGQSTITDCLKPHVTAEVLTSVVMYGRMNQQTEFEVDIQGKTYELTLSEKS